MSKVTIKKQQLLKLFKTQLRSTHKC